MVNIFNFKRVKKKKQYSSIKKGFFYINRLCYIFLQDGVCIARSWHKIWRNSRITCVKKVTFKIVFVLFNKIVSDMETYMKENHFEWLVVSSWSKERDYLKNRCYLTAVLIT